MAAKVTAEPGTVVGDKYRVVRVIGTGGMGVVYEARHLELGQKVALKLLQSGDDEEQVQRFLREARASARLKSDHAAKVVDVGRQRSGAPFMVMELLAGKDLAEVSSGRPLPPAIAVSYILQACEAVAEAHALGIVHRDLKPSNLFLTERTDGQPLVKVLDFGIAKMIRHDGDGKLTGTGAVMGSPQYMSPEQLRSSRDVDQRSDIWSLGVCLYELLSGRTPFEADAVPEMYVKIMRDAPAPIQGRVPSLPPDLGAAIMRCIEKEPARRWNTVFEFASAIEPFAVDAARGSAARISVLLSKTGRSDPPPALEEAAIAAALPRSMEATAIVPREEKKRGLLIGGVFIVTALIGIGAGAIALRKPPTPTPTSTEPVSPLASEIEPASVSSKSEPEPAPTTSASVVITPSARPITAIRTTPSPVPKPAANPTPSARPTSELKTKFE